MIERRVADRRKIERRQMDRRASVETALRVLPRPAADLPASPWPTEVIDPPSRLEAALSEDEEDCAAPSEFCGMVGASRSMRTLWQTIRRLAPHARTVLI